MMRSYTIEVTGAKYVNDVVHVEAEDNPGAIIQADAIVADEFDWDEMHSRTIVAVSNIKLPNPIDAEDIMGEIEEAYGFEGDDEIVLEFTPEGLDVPAVEDVALLAGVAVDEAGELEEIDFFLDEDGEAVIVEREDIEADAELAGVVDAMEGENFTVVREDISDEITGGVSEQSYEQDGEGM
jgi:hypothetical protein